MAFGAPGRKAETADTLLKRNPFAFKGQCFQGVLDFQCIFISQEYMLKWFYFHP